jgi:hypothetical protein
MIGCAISLDIAPVLSVMVKLLKAPDLFAAYGLPDVVSRHPLIACRKNPNVLDWGG